MIFNETRLVLLKVIEENFDAVHCYSVCFNASHHGFLSLKEYFAFLDVGLCEENLTFYLELTAVRDNFIWRSRRFPEGRAKAGSYSEPGHPKSKCFAI